MTLFDARTARVLATIFLFALALAFIYLAWRTLVTFLFAILFAYLLEPLVAGLEYRLHLSRGKAVTLIYAVIVFLLLLTLTVAGPSLAHQAAHLSDLASNFSARITSGQIAHEVGTQRGWSYQTQYRIQQFLAQHRQTIQRWANDLVSNLTHLAANILWVALIPILAIFFLLSGDRYSEAFVDQLARRWQRAFAAALFQDVHDVLASYIRGQIILTGLGTAIYLAGFLALRVPYAIALAIGAGLLEFIPLVGPLVAFVGVVATAFLVGYKYIWLLILFIGAQRVMQDYFNAPHILGNQVELNPLAVLFGVLAGAELAGVIGVYLSIPVMATLRVVWVRWREFQAAQRLDTASAETANSSPIRPVT